MLKIIPQKRNFLAYPNDRSRSATPSSGWSLSRWRSRTRWTG